ncbi:MAG: hypothetical protein JJU06_04480 [Ectothiorhodospiraceae bacterium]|nr:hypothetical protein [Ectothiorhodospiraceae bacterium]MCH8503346.1 hypothetical protein [Ectothiorhodospiraceae bacterium]
MEPIAVVRLLRELILLRAWQRVQSQLDLLHVRAIAHALSDLDRELLLSTFELLPASRRCGVFAHLGRREQIILLELIDQREAWRIVQGLLPAHRQALLRSLPKAALFAGAADKVAFPLAVGHN